MQSHVRKWGNSLGVRIPQPFAAQIGLKADEEVNLTVEKDRIVIERSKYKLDDMLSKISQDNIHGETKTGHVTGNEEW